MDLTKELLVSLPAYNGGKMSLSLYNCGGGLYDERIIEEKPFPIADGSQMSAEVFQAAVDNLYLLNRGKKDENAPSGMLSSKIYFNNRVLQLKHSDGKVRAYYIDEYEPMKEDKSSFLRSVIKTDKDEFLAYIKTLEDAGFSVCFENEIENNIYRELIKDGRLIYASFTGNDSTARFIDDKVSIPVSDFGYFVEGEKETTELYQYALRQDNRVDGIVTDCGMNYVIKLSDNSLFLVDGGEYEQATDPETESYYNFIKELSKTENGEKVRIACWFCTHAHDDHLDFFSKLLRLHHEDIELQRVMFNFPAPEFFKLMPQAYSAINRIKRYYPEVKYLKPHSGQSFYLADTKFEIIQTHEDFVYYGGNECPDGFNDTSTVLKITFDNKTFLMLGDINDGAEGMLLRHFCDKTLKADIVQAAHHLFNELHYIYDVADPEYILVPSRPACRTNHDKIKYSRLILSCKEENILFGSEDGTHGLCVKDGKTVRFYHAELSGTDYDGSDL